MKRIMKSNFLLQGLVIIAMILLTSISIISFPSKAHAGLLIRGGTCSADAFEKGAVSVQKTTKGNYIEGLSVNYTKETDNKAEFKNYIKGIANYSEYCVSKDKEMEMAGAKIKKDPTNENPLHATLSGLSKEIAGKLTRYK